MTYRQGFDHLGNRLEDVPQPWRLADLLRAAAAVALVIAALSLLVV